MLGGILVIVLTATIAILMVDRLAAKFPFISASLLKLLFFFHTFMLVVYYLYAMFNPSDSRQYYLKVLTNYRGPEWGSFYGTSTTFIEFLAYPFIKFLGFNYEAMMALYSFFGFLGFLYMYVFFRENIKFKHSILGYDLITVIFFLPNLHFWSTSFGKGAIIFMGIGLFFFGLSQLRSRWLYALLGAIIIYHVRPHIMLVVIVSSAIGFIFSTRGVSTVVRISFLIGSGVAFFFIYRDVLTLVGIDETELITDSFNLSHRAKDLTKATSGIDITNYSLPEQLFAFLYRPLFFDAPGLLGIIVSFENVFYLLMTLYIVRFSGVYFVATGSFLVKSAFLSFITVSIALAQISGNLGLAMRQKSQVMILFLFVIIAFLDKKKMDTYQRAMKAQLRKARQPSLIKTKTV